MNWKEEFWSGFKQGLFDGSVWAIVFVVAFLLVELLFKYGVLVR